MLAEKLLEGYNGFYSNSSEINESIVGEYIQEACTQAIENIMEAAQQYYTADIVGQSQVLMEGSNPDSKIKQIWEAFKKRIKKILQWFKEKIQKAISAVKNAFGGSKKHMEKKMSTISDQAKKMPRRMYAVPVNFVDNCDDGNKLIIAAMNEIIKFVNEEMDKLKNLNNMERFIEDLVLARLDSGGEPVPPVKDKPYTINGEAMSSQELIEEIDHVCSLMTSTEKEEISVTDVTGVFQATLNIIKECDRVIEMVKDLEVYVDRNMPKTTDPKTTEMIQDFVARRKQENTNDPNHVKEDAVVMALCTDLATMINNISIIASSSLNVLSAILRYSKTVSGAVQINTAVNQTE